MTPQDLLLMEHIADKELKFGCMYKSIHGEIFYFIHGETKYSFSRGLCFGESNEPQIKENSFLREFGEILGTPPGLARCLAWIGGAGKHDRIIGMRNLKHDTILQQSDELKDFIIGIIDEGKKG